MSNERQINYVNNLQNRAQNLYYVDDANELNNINLKENDKIYAINDNKLFQMEIADQEEELGRAIVSFNGRNNTKISSLKVDIEPIQDLHGYDNPWPAGGGKNLLPLDAVSQTINGIAVTVENGTVKLNGTATDTVSITVTSSRPVLPVANYFANGGVAGGSDSTYRMRIVVYNSDHTIAQVVNMVSDVLYNVNVTAEGQYLSAFINVFAGTTVNNIVYKPMVIVTSEPDRTFAPYSNICPISGRTSATVTRTGANVWDEQWEVGSINSTTGKNVSSSVEIRTKNFIPIKENTDYYQVVASELSTANNIKPRYYDKDKHYLGSGSVVRYNSAFTTIAGACYFRFCMQPSYGTTYKDDISLNYPATDHDYHPYTGNTYTIQLGETVYGGTLDVTGGKMVVDRAYKLLNDADKWETTAGTVTYRYNEEISRKLYDNSYTGLTCTIAPTISNANYTARWQGAIVYYFGIADKATTPVTSLDAIKAMATAGQIAICYAIEPVEITLTPTQIDTLLGTNNIWADCGDINIKIVEKGITAFELEPHI